MIEIKEGAKMVTANGEKAGSIEGVVIHPRTRQVTHLVVRKAGLLSQAKVLPMEFIQTTADDTVILRQEELNLDDLPDFYEREFLPLDESEMRRMDSNRPYFGGPYYWYPAFGSTLGTGLGGPFPSAYPVPSIVEENIPQDTVALKEGSRVIGADDKHVGDLEEVLISPESGQATHFIISKGLLFKEEKLIPAFWIDHIDEDEVHLSLGSTFIGKLPKYEKDELPS